jgi:Zn-dependent protease
MPVCYHCGMDVAETFFCSRCGQNYCSLHKEAIDHECNIVIESLKPSQLIQESSVFNQYNEVPTSNVEVFRNPEGVVRGTSDGTYTWYRQEKAIPQDAFDPSSGIKFKGIMLAHKSELIHFIIGSTLIFILGLISFYNPSYIALGYGWGFFLLAGFYTTAFLFHELGHRQVARHFNLQTKFRLLTFGMYLTIISIIFGLMRLLNISPPFPTLALPGAVVVLGLEKISRKTGLCKAAGPTINLIYGGGLFLISFLIPNFLFPLNYFLCIAANLNFMLGAFNMLPFGILDGQNIWKWKKKVYFSLMSSLLILLIITLIILYTSLMVDLYFI